MSNPLDDAQKCLKIDGVYLRNSGLFVNDDFEPAQFGTIETVTQQYRKVLSFREGLVEDLVHDDEFYEYQFNYAAGVRVVRQGESDANLSDLKFKPLIEIEATFFACYFSREQLSDDLARAFSEHNVGYHVWPYWREYVQSTCARVGLVPIISLPMYNDHKRKQRKPDTEDMAPDNISKADNT